MQDRFVTKIKIAQKAVFILFLTSLPSIVADTFVVPTTTDTYQTSQPGELRWAIQQSNMTSGSNTINFNIAGNGPFTITPVQDFDAITQPVTIDGYSQPGSYTNTLSIGNNATLMIELSGNNYTEGNAYAGSGNALYFASSASESTVRGLIINGWVNTGIFVDGANNINITGNFIGTNQLGTAQIANQAGVYIQSSDGCVIGTTHVADRNLFAGSFFYFNASACIEIENVTNTSIVNNYIGTDKTGTISLGNSLVGIECINCDNITIGGSTATARNIISGHAIMGLSLISVTNSTIKNNYIGTNARGTTRLGNGNMGISLAGGGQANLTSGNNIEKNVISANNIGIKLGYASIIGTNFNTITQNMIGTNALGTAALSNNIGIVINDDSNLIGGGTSHRNIISGNTIGGVLLYDTATTNTIQGNYIGLNATNTSSLANGYGIQVGLASALDDSGSNLITNNSFGGGNTLSSLC